VIRNTANIGFAGAANQGAARASGELLLFLNPDATPAPGMADAIRAPLLDGRGWAAWMGLVTQDDGRLINTSGGVVHFTGVAWAGESGVPVADAPRGPREVAFASGACLAVRREAWDAVGGFAERFFMYHEDVDLSLRLRLAGGSVGIEPSARVDHDYEFAKSAAKWFHLERNRWATIVRCYPGPLLALLAPALLAGEIAIVVAALAGGWDRQKANAAAAAVRMLPALLRERRAIQRSRAISASQFATALTPDLDSSFLGPAARSQVLQLSLRIYWRAVVGALARVGR
jgi:GT2 family glycosyltransferase